MMECKFQIGDPVVCVEEMFEYERAAFCFHGPVLDEVYHISKMCLNTQYNCVLVRLREISSPEGWGFKHFMFRKLITPEEFMSKDVGLPVDSGDKVPERV